MKIIKRILNIPKYIVVFLIKIYQFLFSTDHAFWANPKHFRICTYHPSCSEFTKVAILKHGILKGGIMGTKRIIDCNPFSKAGYDPVPDKFTLKRYQGKDSEPAFD